MIFIIINSLGFIILLLVEKAANSAGLDLAEATEMERVQDNSMPDSNAPNDFVDDEAKDFDGMFRFRKEIN